ncbi:uncharacterized protein LOC123428979 [Hordeum vulgare subsp. vulgare]|uniref:uncharacterized protein LOC123428979 n=1 Tax=Hordeum vulgare subsp. vulgare TaxID=112509 RepID=UPI001D1A33CC|nr:uncharacterized protein LOC123428979 [Hordeum vulgare subsp. vulgare]
MEPRSRGDDKEKQVVDFMLQDMEKLGHQMLSMLHSLKRSNSHRSALSVCSYKARELCCATSRLHRVISSNSKELAMDQQQEGEEEKLFNKFPADEDYEHEFARLVAEEEEDPQEEDPRDSARKFDELAKEEAEEQAGLDTSSMEYLNKRMEAEQTDFAYVRTSWENSWASKDGRCGDYSDTTALSPMYFTHYTPGVIPSPAAVTATTLQVYSIKIKILKDLKWPLRVYGVVAARDTVDRNCNILFHRSKSRCQQLTQQDCCLCLTGPSRAIVAMDPVDFEVALYAVEGVDKGTMLMGIDHRVEDGATFSLSDHRCVAEFNLEQLDRSLQATILGVRVTKGPWPFKYGCRIVCSWSPFASTDHKDEDVAAATYCRRLVLLDHCGKGVPRGSDNNKSYLDLSRKVVSVESKGTLRVGIEAYGKSRRWIARKDHIDFPVHHCQISMRECSLGEATVEVAVAWSLLVNEKADLLLDYAPMSGN